MGCGAHLNSHLGMGCLPHIDLQLHFMGLLQAAITAAVNPSSHSSCASTCLLTVPINSPQQGKTLQKRQLGC